MSSTKETVSRSDSGTPGDERTLFGHPWQLGILFNLEMWERFSFYGMQGILAFYMYYTAAEGGLGMDKAQSLALVGAYGGSVYLMTIIGAWLADRVLGRERVLFFSAILIMLGHIALALIPAAVGLLVGLILVAVGSGGLKATASTMVGTLYTEKDPRRDAGFSIFYMGVNLGAFFGPLITGLLQTKLGFHYGFGAAALGMLIGLIVYSTGRTKLPESSFAPTDPLPAEKRGILAPLAIGVVVVLAAILWLGLKFEILDWLIFGVAVIAAVAYFAIMLRSPHVDEVERSRVKAFIPLFIAVAAFWAMFQQQFTFIALYSDTKLDRNLFGWEFPPSWVQSINAVFVIIFASVFAAIWGKLGNRAPSSPAKFGMSLIIIGLAYFVFIPFADSSKLTPVLVLIFVLFLFTVAELFLSPIGLSLTTKLAPKAFVTQMMALFFLASSIGTTLAGTISTYYNPENERPYFVMIGVSSIVLGAVLLAAVKPIRKLMRGVL